MELMIVWAAAMVVFALFFVIFRFVRKHSDQPVEIHLCSRGECTCRHPDPDPDSDLDPEGHSRCRSSAAAAGKRNDTRTR